MPLITEDAQDTMERENPHVDVSSRLRSQELLTRSHLLRNPIRSGNSYTISTPLFPSSSSVSFSAFLSGAITPTFSFLLWRLMFEISIATQSTSINMYGSIALAVAALSKCEVRNKRARENVANGHREVCRNLRPGHSYDR